MSNFTICPLLGSKGGRLLGESIRLLKPFFIGLKRINKKQESTNLRDSGRMKFGQLQFIFIVCVAICIVLFGSSQMLYTRMVILESKTEMMEKNLARKLEGIASSLEKLKTSSQKLENTTSSMQVVLQHRKHRDPFSKWIRRNKPPEESPPYCVHLPSKTISAEYPKYRLVASFYVRIHPNDLSQLSKEDLLHFLTFLKYAGVEHVYLHDNWLVEEENLVSFLQENVRLGQPDSFVTYNDWHKVSEAYHIKKKLHPNIVPVYEVEVPAKEDVRVKYSSQFEWWLDMDMDEYVFFRNDVKEGFLRRFVDRMQEEQPTVAQFTFQNYLVVGHRNRSHSPLLIQQLNHIFNSPPNRLVKTLCYGPKVKSTGMHSYSVDGGTRMVEPQEGMLPFLFHVGPRF